MHGGVYRQPVILSGWMQRCGREFGNVSESPLAIYYDVATADFRENFPDSTQNRSKNQASLCIMYRCINCCAYSTSARTDLMDKSRDANLAIRMPPWPRTPKTNRLPMSATCKRLQHPFSGLTPTACHICAMSWRPPSDEGRVANNETVVRQSQGNPRGSVSRRTNARLYRHPSPDPKAPPMS